MSLFQILIATKNGVDLIMEPPSGEQVVKVGDARVPRRGIVKMDSLEVEGEVVYDR